MAPIFTIRNWLLFSFLWAAFVSYLGWSGWPRLPFDSGNDVLTRQLLQAAIRDHVLVHLGLAVAPPLVMLGIGRLLNRSRDKSE